jgi:hypothetical protein
MTLTAQAHFRRIQLKLARKRFQTGIIIVGVIHLKRTEFVG